MKRVHINKTKITNLFSILSIFFMVISISSCKNSTEPDRNPPTITIAFPIDGSTVSETVTITAIASDDRGIQKVNLWVDGYPIEGMEDTTEPYELKWNTSASEDGSVHSIVVRAFDKGNNVTDSSPIFLTVDNSNFRPAQIELNPILYQNDSFIISWPQSTDNDFDSYILYESLLSDMSDSSTVFSTSDRNTNSFTVTGVSKSELRYYRLTVVDTVGLQASSSIKTGSWFLAEPALVAYYPFDSDAADESGNDNDGNLFGPTFQTGIKGNALEFDGENDFAEIPHSSMFNSNAKTISFWFFKNNDSIRETPNKSDLEGLIWKAFDTTQQRPFSVLLGYQSPPFRVAFQVGNNEGDFFSSQIESVVPQQWYHVVGISSEIMNLLYIDGTLVSSIQFTGTIVKNNAPIVLGKASVITDPTRYFNGKIDELLFYDRVLTAEEIQALNSIAQK